SRQSRSTRWRQSRASFRTRDSGCSSQIPRCFLLSTPRPKFHHPFPVRFAIGRTFATPQERVRTDLVEAPACGVAGGVLAELDDVVALRAADHRQISLSNRLGPGDVPGIDARIVD